MIINKLDPGPAFQTDPYPIQHQNLYDLNIKSDTQFKDLRPAAGMTQQNLKPYDNSAALFTYSVNMNRKFPLYKKFRRVHRSVFRYRTYPI